MPQRARPPLGAAVVDALTEAVTARLPYKAAALFFACALWVLASGDEPVARYVDVRLAPVLDDDAQLVGSTPQVRALVAGPARELLKLSASPPVLRRAVTPGASDTARVELRPSDVDLPSGVEGVAVRDIRPRVITFHFEPPAARRLLMRTLPAAAPAAMSDSAVPDSVLSDSTVPDSSALPPSDSARS